LLLLHCGNILHGKHNNGISVLLLFLLQIHFFNLQNFIFLYESIFTLESVLTVFSRRASSSSSALTSSNSSPSLSSSLPQPTSSESFRVSASTGVVLKRRNARRDTKRVPYKYQKDRRSKFKSTEDLLHRLYVCISGAADQVK
jgi:hypothetical protein